jgi:hypothetical protein
MVRIATVHAQLSIELRAAVVWLTTLKISKEVRNNRLPQQIAVSGDCPFRPLGRGEPQFSFPEITVKQHQY